MKLYKHQEKALEQTAGFRNIAFFHDMGLGKTYTGSEAMIRFDKRVNLIVCQKSKVKDWMDHLGLYGVRTFDLTVPKNFRTFMGLAMGDRFAVYGVINYELAWRRKELLNLQDFTLMLDESSLIQNPKAKQTKFIMMMRPSHVILLSGSPVGGKYENLWTQGRLLGWKITETAFDKMYVNRINLDVGGFIHKIVDKNNPYKNVDRLKRKFAEHGAVFLKTEEVIDLPDQIFQQIHVPVTKEYKTFRKNRMVTVDGAELIGDTSLTALLCSRQLCSQYNKDKLEAFRDLLQSTNDRLVVFYNFDAELTQLRSVCIDQERPISEINGHNKDLTAYEQESNSVTLCQYQSGSMGLNLQESNRIVYFTLPLSSEQFEQSKKRIHRIGQKQTCFYYLLICQGSVEEQILQTLEQRRDYTDELFKEFNP